MHAASSSHDDDKQLAHLRRKKHFWEAFLCM
jgi:hypothetical protein